MLYSKSEQERDADLPSFVKRFNTNNENRRIRDDAVQTQKETGTNFVTLNSLETQEHVTETERQADK